MAWLLATGCALAAFACGSSDGEGNSTSDIEEDAGTTKKKTSSDSGAAATPVLVNDGATDGPVGCADFKDTCDTARYVGSMPGDLTGSITVSGFGSEWVKVKVREADNNSFAAPMKMTARLQAPQGAKYEMKVHLDPLSPTPDCVSVLTGATADRAQATWGETADSPLYPYANGQEDSRMVVLEIRFVGGTCDAKLPWHVVISGG